jgi:hypothetical protein
MIAEMDKNPIKKTFEMKKYSIKKLIFVKSSRPWKCLNILN